MKAWKKGKRLGFFCPGCCGGHYVNVGKGGWDWNGSFTSPTLSPSVLVTGHVGGREVRCHSYIRDGKIQFLGDCSHELAGKTVELLEDEDDEG